MQACALHSDDRKRVVRGVKTNSRSRRLLYLRRLVHYSLILVYNCSKDADI